MFERDPRRKQKTQAFVETAKKRFKFCADESEEQRGASMEDLKFLAGEQWPSEIEDRRKHTQRPCLTVNRLPQFVFQVTNEMRQNRSAVQVNPVSEGADEETAQILQGIMRHIEYDSNADVAYDAADFYAASIGFGYFRVVTEYSDAWSFEQDIKIKRVHNPFTVFVDPLSQEPDASDARFMFVTEDMDKEEFEQTYPDSKLAALADWTGVGADNDGWFQDGKARVVEYFYRAVEQRVVCQMSDGATMFEDEIPEATEPLPNDPTPQTPTVVKKRTTMVPTVKWAKINGIEVLEEGEWPGQWIPIIPVLGVELNIDGRRVLSGIVRNAKDPQRMYNYWVTAGTEMIALAPKAPFIMAEGQDEGHEREWASANVETYASLKYKPISLNGHPLPPPQRNVYEPPVRMITEYMAHAADDMKATTGIYDSQLGAQGNEQTGRAILARQQQGQVSNYHFPDNAKKSRRHLGRILLDLIPKIYDTHRIMRIIHEDGTQETKPINGPSGEFINGVERIYDLSVGKYSVTLSAGPSYNTRRQEMVASMMSLVNSYPDSWPIMGDILVKHMDWPGANDIAARMKKMLPPQLQEQKEGEQQLPPQVQQMMQQEQQMIDQLTKALQEADAELKSKQADLDVKMRIVELQCATELEKARMSTQSREATVGLATEVQNIHKVMEQEHKTDMLQRQQQHAMELQQAQAQMQPAPQGGMLEPVPQPQPEVEQAPASAPSPIQQAEMPAEETA